MSCPFSSKNASGRGQPESGREERVVADHRMHVQRQVGAVNRHVVLEQKGELTALMGPANRLKTWPEKTVVHEQ